MLDRKSLPILCTRTSSLPIRGTGSTSQPGDEARRDQRTLEAATRVLADLDRPGALLPLLRRLALEYRKYGVREPHYRAFAGSVMTALERTIGEAWTYEAAAAWVDELTMVASAMLGIAAEADAQGPAYWEAEVVAVDRMAEDVVRLRVRTAFPYPYQAGQYAAIELGRLPWVWRDFSFAAAPRADAADPEHSVLEFHVQRTAEGRLSNVVHDELEVGDRIRIAAPAGELAFPAGASRLLAVGHGTGLAPIAALLEDAAAAGDDRPVHIVIGSSLNAAKPAKKAAAKKAAKTAAKAGAPAAAKKAAKTAKAAAGSEGAGEAAEAAERLRPLKRRPTWPSAWPSWPPRTATPSWSTSGPPRTCLSIWTSTSSNWPTAGHCPDGAAWPSARPARSRPASASWPPPGPIPPT